MNSGDWEWFTAGKWYEISRYGEENKGDDYTKADIRKFKLDKINGVKNR